MSSSTVWPAKSPTEVKLYGLDWTKRLDTNEYIVSSSWELPEGITVDERGLSGENPKIAVLLLSGGVVGKTYSFLNRIGTSEGQLLEVRASISVKAR